MRSLSGFKVSLVLILAIVFVAAGCARTVSTTTATPSPTVTPTASPTTTVRPSPTPTVTVPTGTLRVAQNSLGMEIFDPVKTNSATVHAIGGMIMDPLVMVDQKGKLTGLRAVAEKWEVAPDGLSWIYSIRKGIKFHDGSDLTAADVKFSLDRFISKDAFAAEERDAVDRVEMVDASTVRVYTKGVRPFVPNYQTIYPPQQGTIMPKAYFETVGAEEFARKPMGSGPFKFLRHVPGDRVEYEANASYWQGAPAFKNLEIVNMPEETTRIAALKTGTVDVIEVTLENLVELDKAGLKWIENGSAQTAVVHIVGAYHPDGQARPTANVKVRQAMALAINRDEINKNLFYGKSGPALPSRLPAGATDYSADRWAKWSAENLRYDPAKAKQLLVEAGYPAGFSDFELYVVQKRGEEWIHKLTEVIQAQWKSVGINAKIVTTDDTLYKKYRTDPDPKIIGTGLVLAVGENPVNHTPLRVGFQNAKGWYRLFATSKAESAVNLDDLINKIDSEPDVVKRSQLVDQILEKTADTYLVTQVASMGGFYGYGPKVAIPVDYPRPLYMIGPIVGRITHAK